MSQNPSSPSIIVATCAYKRADGLQTLLTALTRQSADINWRLVVVDNDPLGSAREIVEARRAEFAVPVEYVFENAGRLVAARNAVLNMAGPHESVLFIDDDCEPNDNWLASFAAAAVKFPEAVLAGPMVAQLEPGVNPPDWASNLWFFATDAYDDGQLVSMTGDGNTLLPPALIHNHALRFEPYFDAGRGQDTDLFMRWIALGGEIRRVSDGIAIEWTPASRTSRKYLRSRSRSAGYGFTRICLFRRSGRARRLATTGVDLAVGTARYAAGVAGRDADKRGRAVYDLSIGLGSLQAFAEGGKEALEARIHGRSKA